MPTTYTVKKGETLSGIAKKHGVKYQDIKGYRSGDPNLIYPGESLTIPTKAPVPTIAPKEDRKPEPTRQEIIKHKGEYYDPINQEWLAAPTPEEKAGRVTGYDESKAIPVEEVEELKELGLASGGKELTTVYKNEKSYQVRTDTLQKWLDKGYTTEQLKAAKIGAYEPLVDAGKDLQNYYETIAGASKSETELKARYRELGGIEDWTGSVSQYKWMLQQEKKLVKDKEDEKEEEELMTVYKGGKQYTVRANTLQNWLDKGYTTTPGDTGGAGATTKTTLTGDTGGVTTGAQVNVTDTNVPMDTTAMTDLMEDVMKDVQDVIGSTDIAAIMTEVAGEEFSPEMEIAGEEKEAQLEALKTNSAKALKTMQQNLAKRGMTFSGIRTTAEADLAAETLAAEAGINRDFAARIVNAARNEQSRRESALNVAQQNYNKYLTAAGYVYNPFTDKIEPTLEYKNLVARVGKEQAQLQMEAQRIQISAAKEARGAYEFDVQEARREYEFESQQAIKEAQLEINAANVGLAQAKTAEQLRISNENLKIAQRKLELAEEKAAKETAPGVFSGKYSEDYLATRANDFITEDGGIDWLEVDKLENVDKDFYNDTVIFLQNALKTTGGTLEPAPTTPAKKGIVGKTIEAFQDIPDIIKWLFD